jgi:hypothetical protein
MVKKMTPNIAYLTYLPEKNGLFRNIGDRVIYLGVKNIMRLSIGNHHITEIDFDGEMPDLSPFDAVVVCGTPQISKVGSPLPIHLKIIEALEKFEGPVLNLGAGSFFFTDQSVEGICGRHVGRLLAGTLQAVQRFLSAHSER